MSVPDEGGSGIHGYPGEVGQVQRARRISAQMILGFCYLPFTLGSDRSDLLHDVYQVRMAKPWLILWHSVGFRLAGGKLQHAYQARHRSLPDCVME